MRVTISEKEIEKTNKIIKDYFNSFGPELSTSTLLAIWSDETRLNQILELGGGSNA